MKSLEDLNKEAPIRQVTLTKRSVAIVEAAMKKWPKAKKARIVEAALEKLNEEAELC